MSNQNTFTIQFGKEEFAHIESVLKANNWIQDTINNPYTSFRLKSPSGSIATMYSSGKLVFQGREDFTSVIANIKSKGNNFITTEFKPHVGVDEVGKGDYFGPLVVVSCFVTEEFRDKVTYLGFADSKKFTDKKIENLFKMVEDYPYYYTSIVSPMEYNKLVSEYKNASILLAKQHSIVIEKALHDLNEKGVMCAQVVVDQFSSSKNRVLDELGELGRCTELVQFHQGESDIAVAAASIIARGVFLREWESMCEKYDFRFPKGASNVLDEAKLFVSKYGTDELNNVAKVSFKTTQQIFTLL